MRPTNNCFRSPKETTPGFRVVNATPDGRRLGFSCVTRPTFSKESRFGQYKTIQQITGFMVGPGAYNNERRSTTRERI
jgi:hypothetical protein